MKKSIIADTAMLSLSFAFNSRGRGPAGPGDGTGGKIVLLNFDTACDRSFVCRMNLHGSGMRQLLLSSEILGSDEYHIATVNDDGSCKNVLTPVKGCTSCPRWSSDGRYVVFTKDENDAQYNAPGFRNRIYYLDPQVPFEVCGYRDWWVARRVWFLINFHNCPNGNTSDK